MKLYYPRSVELATLVAFGRAKAVSSMIKICSLPGIPSNVACHLLLFIYATDLRPNFLSNTRFITRPSKANHGELALPTTFTSLSLNISRV